MPAGHHNAPSLLRRLAAIAYDLLVLLAVLLVCSIPLPLLPEDFRGSAAGHWLLRVYAVAISFVFFAWFWTHGGQTVGMKAWRIRAVTADGGELAWHHASKRYAAALLSWLPAGLGFLWALIDRDQRTWHDRLSGTRLILISRPRSSGPAQEDQASQQK